MEIRGKLTLNTLASVISVAVLMIIQFVSMGMINKEFEKAQSVAELKSLVSDLANLAFEYSIDSKNESVLKRWQSRYGLGSTTLQKVAENYGGDTAGENIALLSMIKSNYSSLGRQFSQLLQTSETWSKLIEQGAPEEEVLRAKATSDSQSLQLSITARSLISSASQLENNSFERSERAKALNINLALLLAMVLAMIINALILAKISKDITEPIYKMIAAEAQAAQGNFKTRLDLKPIDEFEELGKAFNQKMEALEHLEQDRKEVDEAKTTFLTITSHELRSPMTPMKAQLQMLERGYFGKLNKKQMESLSIVSLNADRLDKILLDFLDISRLEAARLKFEFKKTDMNLFMDEIMHSMKGATLEKKIRLVGDIKDLPIIDVDPDRLSQVLRNMLINAIKFSPESGKITVSASVRDQFILFSVADQGIGISQENQQKLFEPFYQVEKKWDRKQGGTGLGLAICKGIIESQGGKIWMKSHLGQGSTFYFTVPLVPIKETKPIKMLFSNQLSKEKDLARLFNEVLGPMGEAEFENQKKQNLLTEEKLNLYVDSLEKNEVLSKSIGQYFKQGISAIFGKNIGIHD